MKYSDLNFQENIYFPSLLIFENSLFQSIFAHKIFIC